MKWKSFCLGASLLLHTCAEAVVMLTYRGDAPNTFNLGFPFFTDTNFDLNSDGVFDYRFLADSFVAAIQSHGVNRFISVLSTPPDQGGNIIPIFAGSVIGLDTNSLSGNWYQGTDNVKIPALGSGFGLNFGPNPMQFADAFIGVEFSAADGIHYGWIQYVGYGVAKFPAYADDGTIIGYVHGIDQPGGFINSWAWETEPGVPIIAGAVPESSTFVYIGIGILFLWARHSKSRKAGS